MQISLRYRFIIAGSGLVCLILGWSILRTFHTVTTWAVSSYNEARKNLDEVRKHRGELAVAKKDLAMTAHHLERANVALVAAWRAA